MTISDVFLVVGWLRWRAWPSMLVMLCSASASHSTRTQSRRPFAAAQCIGVRLELRARWRVAPDLNRYDPVVRCLASHSHRYRWKSRILRHVEGRIQNDASGVTRHRAQHTVTYVGRFSELEAESPGAGTACDALKRHRHMRFPEHIPSVSFIH